MTSFLTSLLLSASLLTASIAMENPGSDTPPSVGNVNTIRFPIGMVPIPSEEYGLLGFPVFSRKGPHKRKMEEIMEEDSEEARQEQEKWNEIESIAMDDDGNKYLAVNGDEIRDGVITFKHKLKMKETIYKYIIIENVPILKMPQLSEQKYLRTCIHS